MTFQQQVYSIVRRIPRGKVATYGQIAALVGKPGAAQAVGRAMHQLDQLGPQEAKQYPWWRVINSRGMISTTCHEHTATMQYDLLVRDGVNVLMREDMYWVDLRIYLWKPY